MISFILCLWSVRIVVGVTCGICPIGNESGSVGAFPSSYLGVPSNPTGNDAFTYSTLSIQGVTGQKDEREFLVSLGLVSNLGNQSRPTPYHDKVTLYAAVEAHVGTGDVWAINPLVTQMPDSGDYNAQGIELDFNNENAHRGEADAGEGLAPPVSYGLSISGAASFRSTAAALVSGSGRIWNRGIVFANDCVQQSTFQDLGNPDKSIDIRGHPHWGVYQSSPSSKNLFAGGTGVGISSPNQLSSEVALHVGIGGLRVDGPVLLSGGRRPVLSSRTGGASVLHLPCAHVQERVQPPRVLLHEQHVRGVLAGIRGQAGGRQRSLRTRQAFVVGEEPAASFAAGARRVRLLGEFRLRHGGL